LKVAVSVGLFAFVWSRLGVSTAAFSIDQLQPAWVIGALAVIAFAVCLSGFRWSLLAKRLGADLDAKPAIAITFGALFVGQILPSTLGVDAVRTWLACRNGRPLAPILGALFLDRACGMLGLAALILLGISRLALLGDKQIVTMAGYCVGGLIALAGFAALGLFVTARARLAGWFKRGQDFLAGAFGAMTLQSLSVAICISFCAQSLLAFSIYLAARALGVEVSAADVMAAVPLALLIATLPISINGWGIREGAMVALLGLTGMAPDKAFSLSVMFGAAQFVAVLPGAAYWVFARPRAVD
jgi:uncharacterized membrane protein YbhN (UPF0104 family)